MAIIRLNKVCNFRSKGSASLINLFKHSITTYTVAYCAAFNASLIFFVFLLTGSLTDLKLEQRKEIIMRS